MSIVQRIPGSTFMVLNGMATQLKTLNGMATQLKTNTLDTSVPVGVTVATPTSLISECVGTLPVFATYGINREESQNDFTSFLDLELPGTNTTYTLLGENCAEIATLNDNTYGTYYAQGFLTEANGFTYIQSLYTGYKLSWKKVLDALKRKLKEKILNIYLKNVLVSLNFANIPMREQMKR
jgi:hypothetical protein